MWEGQENHWFLKSNIIINNVMNTRDSLRNTRCLQDACIVREKGKPCYCGKDPCPSDGPWPILLPLVEQQISSHYLFLA